MPTSIPTTTHHDHDQSHRQTALSATTQMMTALQRCRTWLFVPASKMALVPKAFASGADCVIVDLEDAVADAQKAAARSDLQRYCEQPEHRPIWVRINRAGTEAFDADVAICRQLSNIAGVILAKAQTAADIEAAHQGTRLPVIALIESAFGLHHSEQMATVKGLVGFSYGFLDLCNDLGVQVGTPSADIIANQIRYQLLLTSRIHQLLPPIDTVYPDFNDVQGLEARVRLWSQMGLSGMLCIHPKQVATVQQALTPAISDIDFAKRVVETYERSGEAVFEIDGNMVDAPVIARCQQLLTGDDA